MEKTNREWVEEYIDNVLSPEERQLFEKQLEVDTTLAKELDLQLDSIALLRASEKVKLKEEMSTWWEEAGEKTAKSEEKEIATKVVPLKPKKYRYLAAAAMLFLLLSVAYIYFTSNPQPISSETLITQYLSTPPQVSSNSRAANSPTDSIITTAEDAYKMADFKTSIHLFTQITSTPSSIFLDHLYLGLSYLYLPQQTHFSQAIIHLQKVLETDNDFHQMAQWYLALAYYKEGKILEAKKTWKEIADDPDGDYAKKADDLLQKL